MTSTEIVRRFPAHQGYARKSDVPTYLDMRIMAMRAYMAGALSPRYLATVLTDVCLWVGMTDDQWASLGMRGRALLMSNCYGHLSLLVRIECAARKSAGATPRSYLP